MTNAGYDAELHLVDLLFRKLPDVEPYPTGTLRVPERIPGLAFFPGGDGLWPRGPNKTRPPMPVGGVMVLGHDFHSESGYKRSLAAGEESLSSPTWRQLLPILGRAGIDRQQCFFTNAYMGLREGTKATGPFRGARDSSFVDRCRRFLDVQLGVQRPRLIMTLGAYVPAMLAPLSPDLGKWVDTTTLTTLDELGCAVVAAARFPGAGELSATVVALTHPSQRRLNVHRRRYGGAESEDAEALMLENAERTAAIEP